MIARRIAAGLPTALVAITAVAGDSALEPPELERYLRWGPLRARPGFELVNAGYDNNILSSSTETVADYTATVFAKLEGLMLFGSRAFLTFDERFGYQAYLENPDQNFPLQRGGARLTVPLGQLGVFAEGRIVRDTDRPVDRQDVRADRAEDGLAAGLIVEPGWRTSLELAAYGTRWRFSDPDLTLLGGETVAERLDRDERSLKLRGRYRWRGRTSFTFDAQRGSIGFVSPDPLGKTKDSEEWRVRTGIALETGGSLTGSALFGWQQVDALDPSRADFAGMVGEAELAYRPLGRTTFRLEALRQPGFSVTDESVYYLDTHATLSVIYYLNRIFGLEAGSGRGVVSFPAASGATERRDDFELYNLAVRLRVAENSIGRRVEYRLALQHYERSSPVPSASLDKTTLGLNATLGF